MKFTIKWVDGRKPTGNIWSTYVEPELNKVFANLENAEDLVFHTIFVGESHEGPIVMAYGKENDPVVYLDYLDDVKWMNLV